MTLAYRTAQPRTVALSSFNGSGDTDKDRTQLVIKVQRVGACHGLRSSEQGSREMHKSLLPLLVKLNFGCDVRLCYDVALALEAGRQLLRFDAILERTMV